MDQEPTIFSVRLDADRCKRFDLICKRYGWSRNALVLRLFDYYERIQGVMEYNASIYEDGVTTVDEAFELLIELEAACDLVPPVDFDEEEKQMAAELASTKKGKK